MVYLRRTAAKVIPDASFYHDDDSIVAADAFNRGSEDLLDAVKRAVIASSARGDAIDTLMAQIRSVRAGA